MTACIWRRNDLNKLYNARNQKKSYLILTNICNYWGNSVKAPPCRVVEALFQLSAKDFGAVATM